MNDDPPPAPADPPTIVVQVFRDWSERRWRRVCLACLAVLVVGGAIAGIFFGALENAPTGTALEAGLAVDLAALQRRTAGAAPPAPFVSDAAAVTIAPPRAAEERERFAWIDPNDAVAARAVDEHKASLTSVVTSALHVADARGTLRAEPVAKDIAATLRRFDLVDAERPADVTAMGHDPASVERFASDVAARADVDRAQGVALELGDDEADEDDAARAAIVAALRRRMPGRVLAWSARHGTSAASLARIGAQVDRVIIHAHVDVSDAPVPSPPAPRAWVRDAIAATASVIAPDTLVVMFPTRGSTWSVRVSDPKPTASASMAWADLVARCRIAGATPQWDASGNLSVALPGSAGVASSEVVAAQPGEARDAAMVAWMVDAATFADGLAAARARGVRGVGLDDLGGEDPRVWRVLSAAPSDAVERALRVIPKPAEWATLGDGVELRVVPDARDGEALVSMDHEGVARETYATLPAQLTIVRRGRAADKTVSLTFDDGPDPEHTPRVLDALKRRGIRATFFLIGARAQREPELVKRIVAEGHEIGNHSFSHSDLSKLVARRADLEVRATNLLLHATTGRTTLLFRPPYRADDAPGTFDDVESVLAGQRNGVLTVGSSVDPRDWDGTSTDGIVRAVVAGVEADRGGVVLLHDGGGDRRATVAALDPIADALSSRGYRFVQLHDVLGGPCEGAASSLDAVNPPARGRLDQRVSQVVWIGGTWALRLIQWAALLALALGVVRVLSLIVFTLVDLRRHGRAGAKRAGAPPRRSVSVVVPAYNEAKVIERTVRSVLSSEGVDVEVIVLDDGSKDRTGDVVAQRFMRDARVRLVRLANGGKAAALNLGFKLASHEVVVALDADTIFLPQTILELVKPFEDARVGAVAGRAVVGNARGVMGRWQALEYVIGQAVERRAWHVFGVVSVVPGAVGAWRRDAVIEAGGFARDTLAEDSDLTLDLQVRGWRVDYAPDAIALTEAPESVRALVKQRFRWSYGVLQAIWKHRRAARRSANRAVGYLLLPTVLIAHLGTPLLAPAADLAAAIALYLGYGASLVPFAIASLIADLALTVFAMRLDRAPAKMAYDWLLYRAVYRWILFFALVRAIVAALRGGAVGWGKLVRKGTVELPHASSAARGIVANS